MEIRLAVLADYAATTAEGKLVIAGVFDKLFAAELPAAHPRVSLAFRVHVLPEEGREHALKVQYVDPDGNKLLELGGPIPLQQFDAERGADAQFVISFEPLPVNALGRHAFDIFIDDRYEETVSLEVIELKLPDQE